MYAVLNNIFYSVASCCVQSSPAWLRATTGAVNSWTSIRCLRSSVSSDVTKLNAAQEATRPKQEVVENPDDTDLAITKGLTFIFKCIKWMLKIKTLLVLKDVIAKVNAQIQSTSYGRLFAVIQMAGKQRRVTDGDLIMVEGFYPTNVGDVIRAEKILLVGSKDFTLLGRPLLRQDLVRVEATVVEKSLTHTKTQFKKKRRKNYKRIHCK